VDGRQGVKLEDQLEQGTSSEPQSGRSSLLPKIIMTNYFITCYEDFHFCVVLLWLMNFWSLVKAEL